MVILPLTLISFAVWFGLFGDIQGHRKIWTTTQLIWHKMDRGNNSIEIPLENEYLIDNLTAYSEIRTFPKQYHNQTSTQAARENSRNGSDVKVINWKPGISIDINEPISERTTSFLDLRNQITNVN